MTPLDRAAYVHREACAALDAYLAGTVPGAAADGLMGWLRAAAAFGVRRVPVEAVHRSAWGLRNAHPIGAAKRFAAVGLLPPAAYLARVRAAAAAFCVHRGLSVADVTEMAESERKWVYALLARVTIVGSAAVVLRRVRREDSPLYLARLLFAEELERVPPLAWRLPALRQRGVVAPRRRP